MAGLIGARVPVPDVCEICDEYVRETYDVHMVLVHPETRPKPEIAVSTKKPSGRRKK